MIPINTLKRVQLYMGMLLLIPGCTSILSTRETHTTYYSLEASTLSTKKTERSNAVDYLPTLIVNSPKAAAGFDTRRMMYSRSQHQIEYFARNEWVDTPSHMLQPLMVAAIEKTRSFRAVVAKTAMVKADLRLESEVITLLQDFNSKPSVVKFTLRTTIINNTSGEVLALREFNERIAATSDDPVGGVKAANVAVNNALEKLGLFCAETAVNWKLK